MSRHNDIPVAVDVPVVAKDKHDDRGADGENVGNLEEINDVNQVGAT